jgi:trk system potassium uptake protein TrkA
MMRIAIAGAGNVGCTIARDLIDHGHQVLLIEQDASAIHHDAVPGAQWLNSDACELDALGEARLDSCDVVIAATGDDKTNLVHSWLAKTHFGVARTVARVNQPVNEWLFDQAWGVDVAVSTPRIMCALAEEAVAVGDLVPLFRFARGYTNLVEVTLPATSPWIDQVVDQIPWPAPTILVAVLRDGRGLTPLPGARLVAGDELLFLVPVEDEQELGRFLSPAHRPR